MRGLIELSADLGRRVLVHGSLAQRNVPFDDNPSDAWLDYSTLLGPKLSPARLMALAVTYRSILDTLPTNMCVTECRAPVHFPSDSLCLV